MDGLSRRATRGRSIIKPGRRLPTAIGVVALLVVVVSSLAEDHVNSFDGEQPTWRVRVSDDALSKLDQRRIVDPSVATHGDAAEYFLFQAKRGPTQLFLDHQLPTAQVVDDLKCRLLVRGTGGAIRIGVRLVFPRQTDPRTSDVPLRTMIFGDTYTKIGQWQELSVVTSSKAVQDQMRLLRAKFRPLVLDLRQPVVDRITLDVSLDSGRTELLLDHLRFGPVISPVVGSDIKLTQNSEESASWPVSFPLDRLLVHGRPFFPRLMPYHGEPVSLLREAGFNVVWIPDVHDVELQQALKRAGLWATAAPPRLHSSKGEPLSDDQAGLLTIPRDWDNVLAWNMGVALPAEAQRDVLPWVAQVQSADRDRHRPILLDVTGGERIYSRHVSMLGASRHVLNSGMTFKTYREALDQHRKLARPGTFWLTWLPTEPLLEVNQQRRAAGRIPLIIEPEQIRLGAYSALAAGCRGLGYSFREPLDSQGPGVDERRLMISQLNLELSLLEEFLAVGSLVEQRPFKIMAPHRTTVSPHNVGFRNSAVSRAEQEARLAAHKSSVLFEERIRSELEAAVFRTEKATLLLPIWYENDAQFVPGQLAAPGATIDVSSVPDTASAWEVTTTSISSLRSEPIPGGRRVTLPTFDTTAAIVVTSDRSVIDQLRYKMELIQAESARHWIDLAKAKLNRVRIADEELTKLGAAQPDAPQLLARASSLIQTAENLYPGAELERLRKQAQETGSQVSPHSPEMVQLRKRFDDAARYSQSALQLLRILQKAHWQTATHRLAAPVASPHTLCFQTLPDHWRLVALLGKSAARASDDLFPKGDFEVLDFATLSRFGWYRIPSAHSGSIRSNVQVQVASGREGRCLRLFALPETNADPPAVVDVPPVVVTSPPIPVRAGQVLHISGWVRLGTAISGSLEGLTLSDNLTGSTGAWHWHEKREWQRFEMLREVYVDGPFMLTITLHGLGDVQFDDLKLIAHDPPTDSQLATPDGAPKDSESKQGRFDFLKRLPKFPQLPKQAG